jgi:hypothetical protein
MAMPNPQCLDDLKIKAAGLPTGPPCLMTSEGIPILVGYGGFNPLKKMSSSVGMIIPN